MSGHHALIRVGGRPAVGIFIASLIAFVTETQLSQYVQAQLEFNQPYTLFYIVHSTFAITFPLHVLYLFATNQHSIKALRTSVAVAVQRHLSPKPNPNVLKESFPTRRFIRLVSLLTAGMTFPSLFWFIAVALAPVTDVTALWNTNAFFAYIFTVLMTGIKWDPRRLLAVLIATAGVLAVVYGGSTVEVDEASSSADHVQESQKAPLIGDLLTLAASIMYGAYQVLYKLYAALPNDPEAQIDGLYSPLAHDPSGDAFVDVEDQTDEDLTVREEIIDPLPFGLYPNLLTSAIGICTLLFLWIPIPLLNRMGAERFELPKSFLTYCVIFGIALSGSVFNAGLMVLIGVWGPIVVSVGNLLTIVLVFLSDTIFGGGADSVTVWSVLGCGSIVLAFGILAYDMTRGR